MAIPTPDGYVPPEQYSTEPDPRRAEVLVRLDALGQELSKKRKLAIDGRAASGIETDWEEDEDAYAGIDDANRGQESGHRRRYQKARALDLPLTERSPGAGRSTVFLNITQTYVDTGSSKAQEILLPSDDKPWGLDPTPVPELVETIEQVDQAVEQGNVQQLYPQQQAQMQDMKVAAEEALKKARTSCEKAETRIEDWLVEGQWHGEAREVIDDSARVGTGILKGPFPVRRKQNVWQQDSATGQRALVVNEELKPTSKRVDCWNFYPDPLCGEDIHKGNYVWERDDITLKTLRELKETKGYIKEQIEACIREGPQKPNIDGRSHQDNQTDQTPYEIWYFHGQVEKEDLIAGGCQCDDRKDTSLSALITMVNERVIHSALNPLDTGAFPYDVMVWKKRPRHWAGMGIARQVRTPQRMVNAATRNMNDNAGLTAGPQLAIDRNMIEPADGVWAMTPLKLWIKKAEAAGDDVRKAIVAINIETNQPALMAIIQFALKMAEDVTGLPMILQGQQGKAPDTVGGMTILNNNASAFLRRIARLFDHRIIEPHITRYYTWLMEHGEDEEEKGLFVVDARGSTVLVERDIQNQFILTNVAQMLLQPAFGGDPRKGARQIYKAARLNPDDFQYDDQEWKRIQEQQAKTPPDPRLQVAAMNAEKEQALAQQQRDFDAQQNEKDRQLQLMVEAMQHEMDEATANGKSAVETDKLKVMLAKTAIEAKSRANEMVLRQKTGAGI